MVQNTPLPRTRAGLIEDLRQIGLKPGMTVITHSSLSSLGWVCGGPVAVVQTLMDVLTTEGTLVMPTQTGDYTDPVQWNNPPVPQEWLPFIYEQMPAFDPRITPSYHMGRIVETFRTWPGTLRSNHPLLSFAAWGKHARTIIDNQSLAYGLGEQSPLARLYDLEGQVLLLGVGYDSCTSLHLAEYRAPGTKVVQQSAPMYEQGQRVWKTYQEIDLNSEIFPDIGAEFEQTGLVMIGKVGSAHTRLFPQRAAVDFATQWYIKRRNQSPNKPK